MKVCGGGWHGWLGGMDGNMCGDAGEKGGVKDKAEGYVVVTLSTSRVLYQTVLWSNRYPVLAHIGLLCINETGQ